MAYPVPPQQSYHSHTFQIEAFVLIPGELRHGAFGDKGRTRCFHALLLFARPLFRLD